MTRRDTSGDTLAALTAGATGFRVGEPLNGGTDTDYARGWLAAAEDMRLEHTACAQRTLTNIEEVIDVLHDAQRTIKDLTPVKGLTGGRGAKLSATKVKLAALLQSLEARL